MKIKITALIGVLFCCLLLGRSPLFAQASGFFTDQVMVQLESNVAVSDFITEVGSSDDSLDLEVLMVISSRLNVYLLQYDETAHHHEAVLAAMRSHPEVVIAQFNHNNLVLRNAPDDPDFSQQWAFGNDNSPAAHISAQKAWDISTGGTTTKGDSIVVAVIDGGGDVNHEDVTWFENHLEIPGNQVDDDGNGYVDDVNGWNVYNNTGNLPASNHGTHVSGTVGAKGNNGTGVTGVNWDVKVMPIAGSSGNEATVLAAYGYALEMRARYNETNGDTGAYVVATNSSFGVNFGQPANFPLWCAFYDSLGAYGILSMGATANLNIDIDVDGDIPTACPSNYMVAVTNTTSADLKNGGAAYGATTIDLGAPGTNIYSTRPGNNYGFSTGTSMATPHVAGAVGLMYSVICEGTLDEYAGDPDGLAIFVKDALIDSGVDTIPALQGITVSEGRLNLFKSLSAVIDTNCQYVNPAIKQPDCGTCNGEIDICVAGGHAPFTFSWSHDGSITGPLASNLCVGIYTITMTDAKGADSTIVITLNSLDAPDVTLSKTDVTCFGGSDGTAILSNISYTYEWSTGGTSYEELNLSAGDYAVTISNHLSCSTVIGFEILEPPLLQVNLTVSDTALFANSTGSIDNTPSGGVPPYTYLWSTADTTEDISGLGFGLYQVTVRDANGCTSEASVLVESVGLEDGYADHRLRIYPNPTSEFLNVELKGLEVDHYQLDLVDLMGRKMDAHPINYGGNVMILPLDLSAVPSGIYFLHLVNSAGISVNHKKLVIKSKHE